MDGVFRYYMRKYQFKEFKDFYIVPYKDGSASIDNWFRYMEKHGFSIHDDWLLQEFWIMPTELYQKAQEKRKWRMLHGNSNDRQLK